MDLTRDYTHIDQYLSELQGDIYQQPLDDGHASMAKQVIENWVTKLTTCNNVLDVGCGQGDMQEWFEELGLEYTGVTLGIDYLVATRANRNVSKQDYTFLSYPDNSFDLIFARHSLEHSFSPILSLMEWHRVATSWLCLILPTPSYWGVAGRNHYSVVNASQAKFLMGRAGWVPIWEDMSDKREFRFMAQKMNRLGYDDSTVEYDKVKVEE